MIKAFLFDLNGTMIDDMPFHISVWHTILQNLGSTISVEEIKQQSYGKNNEMLERIFPNKFSEDEKNSMSIVKEQAYQQEYKPHLKLIHGLHPFLEAAKKQQIKMAIGSAAIMYNIDFVLDNLGIRHYFDAIVSADDVVLSKPAPETYLNCAAMLGVLPEECIVFEDVPKGVESAANAGMKCIVIEGIQHGEADFKPYTNIIKKVKDYSDLDISQLLLS